MSVFDEATKDIMFPIEYFNFVTPSDEPIKQGSKAYYYQTGYAAKLIHAVLQRSGFVRIGEMDKANLIVGGSLRDEGMELEFAHQRVNHYESTFSLGSKRGYHKMIKRFQQVHGFIPDFYPETYHCPEEYSDLKKNFDKYPIWISKPSGGARGNGIYLINSCPSKSERSVVIQRYIDNPMLINGLKFDLRFYVAVTSLVPLRVYLFNNGLVRLATEKYEENITNISNIHAHLTNFSINKEDSKFTVTNDIKDDGKGNKWSHAPFWTWLESNGYDVQRIRSKIEDSILTLVMASREVFRNQANTRESFELFGFDVFLSDKEEVTILEVNVSPALGTSSQLDMHIKAPLVRDIFNLTLIPHASEATSCAEEILAKYESDEFRKAMSVCEYELAQKRLGDFKCIYPTKERIRTHEKFLENVELEDQALRDYILLQTDVEKIETLKNYISVINSEIEREAQLLQDGRN